MESHSRRSFIKSSATLLGAAGAGVSRMPAASDKVNIGSIGFGIRGNYLGQHFKVLPDVNIVAVADLYDGYLQNARETIDDRIQTTKDYRVVLDRKDIDAVIVATPEHWHTRIVLDAISAGKDVYIEKPMTWSMEEGYQIMNAMKNSRRILQVGSGRKGFPMTAKAKEIVKSGVLGKINLVRFSNFRNSVDGAWGYPIPADASPKTVDWDRFLGSAPKTPWSPERFFRWRCWWEYSGGIAADLYVHQLTALHEILSLKVPKSAVSHGGIYRWNDGRTVPDVMVSVLEYPGDFLMELCVNLGSTKGGIQARGEAIMGSEATMLIGGPDGGIVLYREDPNQVWRQGARHFPRTLREQFEAEQGAKEPLPKPIDKEVIEVPRDPAWPTHQEFFLRSVKQRTPSVEDAEVGHNAATACHMANYAFRHNCRAGIDPKTGKLIALETGSGRTRASS